MTGSLVCYAAINCKECVYAITFSPDGQFIAAALYDNCIQVWKNIYISVLNFVETNRYLKILGGFPPPFLEKISLQFDFLSKLKTHFFLNFNGILKKRITTNF